MKYAHLFTNKTLHGGGVQLVITEGPGLDVILATIRPLAGKRDARKLAKQHNATPHNF